MVLLSPLLASLSWWEFVFKSKMKRRGLLCFRGSLGGNEFRCMHKICCLNPEVPKGNPATPFLSCLNLPVNWMAPSEPQDLGAVLTLSRREQRNVKLGGDFLVLLHND